MKAWLFQDHRQKQKLGDACPWSVGYLDPDGKRRSKKVGSKSRAEKFARKIEGQIEAGTFTNDSRKSWAEFRKEYEAKILPRLAVKTRESIKTVLDHFEKHAAPAKVRPINTGTIDAFIAKRADDPGRKPKSKVSPATINHDLRHLKAVLRVAHDWGYLPVVPKFRRVREDMRVGRVMSDEHFQSIFEACDVATMPEALGVPAPEWWRALLVFAITTGWRIREILALRCADVDLESGAIMTQAPDNKGGRDDSDYLPPIALEHVRGLVSFKPTVFVWPHDERTLWVEFQRIQKSAGIELVCRDAGRHECTEACKYYGFHSLRRGYATMNAQNMPAVVLQRKMRHKSFETTRRYIELADKLKAAAVEVKVPDFLRAAN